MAAMDGALRSRSRGSRLLAATASLLLCGPSTSPLLPHFLLSMQFHNQRGLGTVAASVAAPETFISESSSTTVLDAVAANIGHRKSGGDVEPMKWGFGCIFTRGFQYQGCKCSLIYQDMQCVLHLISLNLRESFHTKQN